jgi:hypothetical protein
VDVNFGPAHAADMAHHGVNFGDFERHVPSDVRLCCMLQAVDAGNKLCVSMGNSLSCEPNIVQQIAVCYLVSLRDSTVKSAATQTAAFFVGRGCLPPP